MTNANNTALIETLTTADQARADAITAARLMDDPEPYVSTEDPVRRGWGYGEAWLAEENQG